MKALRCIGVEKHLEGKANSWMVNARACIDCGNMFLIKPRLRNVL